MEADINGSILGTYDMCLKGFPWYQLPLWNFWGGKFRKIRDQRIKNE